MVALTFWSKMWTSENWGPKSRSSLGHGRPRAGGRRSSSPLVVMRGMGRAGHHPAGLLPQLSRPQHFCNSVLWSKCSITGAPRSPASPPFRKAHLLFIQSWIPACFLSGCLSQFWLLPHLGHLGHLGPCSVAQARHEHSYSPVWLQTDSLGLARYPSRTRCSRCVSWM